MTLSSQLTPAEISLEDLYLDPNNPRFTGPESQFIPDTEIDDDFNQTAARQRLIQFFGVTKLRMNMEINGYLPIDRIVIREFKPNKYVVLEGNRRICAAKTISTISAEGEQIATEILHTLTTIPCLIYTGENTDAAWIFQGLRHITGISDWSSYNKAKLLVEQMEQQNLTLTQVGKQFGLTAHGAGQWVRGYYAFRQATEESDYTDEVDERVYPYFQELFSRSSAPVREWMEWSDKTYSFNNGLNFNEFLSWFYPRPTDEEDEAEGPTEIHGDWDRRIVRTQDDIRNVAYLIRNDVSEFESFRYHKDLERAYSTAIQKKYQEVSKDKSDPVDSVFDAITECTRALENIPLKAVRQPESKSQLYDALRPLENAILELKKE